MSALYSIISHTPPFSWYCTDSQGESMQDEVAVVPGTTIDIIAPKRSLLVGSLQIIGKSNQAVDPLEVYQETQRIVQVWRKQGTADYLRYRKVSDPSEYNMQIVPFSRNTWGFWQQLKVLWNVTLGGTRTSQKSRESIVEAFKETETTLSSEDLPSSQPRETPSRDDAFCMQSIIEKQWVFKGRFINILHDYAPIGLEKLHFLLVPKRHCEKLSDLTEEEYAEVEELSQKLIHFYKSKNHDQQDFAAHIFDKTGALAGQTVPHWHQHHVFTITKIQGFWGKLTILKNMIFGSSPLKLEELNTKVEQLREDFKNLSEKTD
ncbi:MAG TPA: HIT domain-containing protein [Candidatus Rhabdochlamydia sp.]|nr:HIT domain-containing protein [Candidatus Rhabdochlamydia sp.]